MKPVSKSGTILMVDPMWNLFTSKCTHSMILPFTSTLHRPQMLQHPEVGQLLVCMSCHAMRGPLWKVNWASHWFIRGVGEVADSLSERSPAGFSPHPLPDVWWSLFYSHLSPPHCVFFCLFSVWCSRCACCLWRLRISLHLEYALWLIDTQYVWWHVEEAVGDIMYLLMHVCSSVLMDAHDLIVVQAYRPQRPSYKLLIAMSYFCLPVHSHVHNPTLHHWTWSILVFCCCCYVQPCCVWHSACGFDK